MGIFHKDKIDPGIVIRVFGENTEIIIDREREQANMVMLHKAGLGPPLYLKFTNGIAYGFVQGQTLNVDAMRDKHMGR